MLCIATELVDRADLAAADPVDPAAVDPADPAADVPDLADIADAVADKNLSTLHKEPHKYINF